MRKYICYVLAALTIATLLSWPADGSAPERERQAHYTEECMSERCDKEELAEMYASYNSECLEEKCEAEEVIEIAGHPTYVDELRSAFERHGWKVVSAHFKMCTLIHTESTCAGVVQICQNHYQCMDKVEESASYECGACLGIGSCGGGGSSPQQGAVR